MIHFRYEIAMSIRDKLVAVKDDVDILKDEEQEAYDALPASAQVEGTSEAEEFNNAFHSLEEASNHLDKAISALTGIEHGSTYRKGARIGGLGSLNNAPPQR